MLETYLHPDSRLADLKAGRELSAADIARAARDQAGRLAAAGVAPRDRVAIAHDDPGALVADLLAVWSLGAAALVFSHAVAPAERDNLLARSRAVALIARGALAADAVAVAVLAPASPDADPPIPPPATAEPDPDDVALVMMTSGTVAEPKGVMLSHRALAARIDLNRRHIGDGDMARSLNVLPMHFGHGLIGNMLTPLAAGARLAAWPDPGPAGLPALGETLDREAITFMSSVPSLWRAAMKLSRPPAGGTLRRVHIGSAPLTRVLWEDIARWCGTRRVFNMFGMTEAANWIAGIGLDDAPGGDQWVGLPWGGALAVTGPAGERLSTGRGEVCVASPSLMSGYLDREEATREVLCDGWLMTGDIGEIDRAGRLRLVGRAKHEINRGGIKIQPEEVDALLESHPAVEEACTFALADEWTGETVAAAIRLATGADPDIASLRSWCAARIRREAVPARFFPLGEIPRNARGKPDRKAAAALCLSGEGRQ